MKTSSVFRADITRFRTSGPTEYSGETLEQINALIKSIQTLGLFSPILVERIGPNLSVIDGKKRVATLTALITASLIPRDLVKIPYVIISSKRQYHHHAPDNQLPLLSNRQQYHLLLRLIESGLSCGAVAKAMYTTKDHIRKIASVARLSRKLKQAVLTNTLSFSQGQAFATLPHHSAQDRLLNLLGAFVDVPTIISAVKTGEPVVSYGDTEDNVIIMPSRMSSQQRKVAIAA